MRAAVLTEFGGPEVLQLREVARPLPQPGWVDVRLTCAALNWHDVLVRRGQYASPLPHVPGADGAGIRVDTGEEVMILPSLHWGRRENAPAADWQILGDHQHGTYAEFVSVPEDCLVPKPPGLSWHEAAALPLVGVTVFRALFSRGRLQAGEHLLVLGAGGGVATMAVSLAAAIGAHVSVTSSSEEKIARAVSAGADDGVLYSDPAWPEEARKLTPDARGFDLVLDSVGTWAESLRALRLGGRLVTLGASRSDVATIAVRPFYFAQHEIIGTSMGSPQDFAGLLSLLDRTAAAPPPVDRVFPLDAASEAHAHLESGTAIGKVVLDIV
ncbi:oxidoreductase [Subtercola boreus]|uniref:Oxidoreductase n=2 Tax=Subtercola boreus TaxID=120213 RepID=A0A3E0VNS1_9MICO|nr:oxidoreductase [Subtercola boreus]TQL55999.1 NADPH:quinone reductase-like Zn-dependent oxidoreductase [Subtercola boreus]